MCLGTLVACGMPWFNLKVIAADREKEIALLGTKLEVAVGRKTEASSVLFDIPTASGVKGEVVLV